MEIRPIRGSASIYMFSIAVLTNAFIAVLFKLVNSYLVYVILLLALVIIDIYYMYYFLLNFTLSYKMEDSHIVINYFWGLKKIRVDISEVKGFTETKGSIHGIKLSGIGNDRFSFGRNIIDKIGTTYMFVSSSKSILYLKTEKMCYAISPDKNSEIRDALIKNNIPESIEEYVENSNIDLHKDKKFLIPFSVISILIVLMILNPFILYLRGMLPETMPLNFDASFKKLQEGTGKQFAFKQMTYGVLNMIILFCMYYAAYFCAKYDRKTAYRYLYLSLAVVLVFFFLQIKILLTFG